MQKTQLFSGEVSERRLSLAQENMTFVGMQISPTLQSFGAAATVTGSKHLVTTVTGEKILLDCGLFQGEGKDSDEKNRNWGFNPREIDFVILSHAHIDHTGLIPKLVRDGFRGPIYCNAATFDLCEIMLMDGAHIQESDLRFINEKRSRKGLEPLDPLYTKDDVADTLPYFEICDNFTSFQVGQSTHVQFIPNAHILGSVAIHLSLVNIEGERVTLTYTGDIGRENDRILDGPHPFPKSDYILCESTYGDRLHPQEGNDLVTLERLARRICVEQKGSIVIPAFSVDRTQEIVYLLDELAFEGKLPQIPVYVDSPLSVKATNIMSKHRDNFNPEILAYIEKDGNPFDFPHLHYTSTVEDSKAINADLVPCIIISASGMAEAGRVKHHIAHRISDPKNAILLVGYATPYSLAGQLIQGKEEVQIFGDTYQVKAEIHRMSGFSAHADYQEMLHYLKRSAKPAETKKIFLVHGQWEAMSHFKGVLNGSGFKDVVPCEWGKTYEL